MLGKSFSVLNLLIEIRFFSMLYLKFCRQYSKKQIVVLKLLLWAACVLDLTLSVWTCLL